MLKRHKILDKIPAYDFGDSIGRRNKEQQQEYIQKCTWGTKREAKEAIKNMISITKDKKTLFALKTILNNYRLLKKTKVVNDGSWRNMKIMDGHLFIDWEKIIGENLEYKEWCKVKKSVTKEDILKVLNNIGQLFIQPRRWRY